MGLLDPIFWKACWQSGMMAFWCWSFVQLSFESATLAFNATWFGAAFLFFAIIGDAAMPWLLPANSPREWYNKVKGATMFLGGMNSAMMLLSALVFKAIREGLFQKSAERRILFGCMALGHYSQFACNVPSFLLSKGVISGELLTPVLRKFNIKWQELTWVKPDQTMMFIFIVDFLGFAVNLYCALVLNSAAEAL